MAKLPEPPRSRGRPIGSIQAARKTAITIRIESEALNRWRASGKGWQTRAAAVLEQHAPQVSV